MALALLLALSLAARTHAQEAHTTAAPPPVPRGSIAAIALSIRSRAIQDSRCYLMNGGAVESFFVSEDTPVGSVIGTLSVNGDPSDDGNISLTLQEKNAAVGIAPGTKNVTLLRALDREERRGPSNVYVNVRCDRRRTTDPSFIIPVSVRVWDVNDNAPVWVGAPYRVRLSELTAVGSRILHNIRATDADQPGPHATIHYSVLPGPNSEYFGFANELDSVLVVKKPLDFETLNNFTVTLRASDQGTPPLYNDTVLRVEVLDADDQNPRFSHDHYTATIPENAEEGTILETSPGPIAAHDQDLGINAPLYYTVSGEKRDLIHVDRDTGRVAVTRGLLDAVDLPLTVVIKATQVDNPDRYALATLWIGRRSAALSRPVRFSRRGYVAAVREDATPGTVLAVLSTEPPRSADASLLQFYVSERSFLEKFAINSAGEVLLRKPLDYETKDQYAYQVMVTDGLTNDTASLNISVLNVNEWEPRFKHPQYEFRVDDAPSSSGLLPVGTLQVHDGDAPDTITLTLRGAHANMFYINSSGEMFLRADALPALNSSVLHVVATAIDSGAPPRQTSVPVLVHVGEKLMSARASPAKTGVVLVFACALALLALLVCALLAYIYRYKRRSKVSTPSPPATTKTTGLAAHDKPRSPPPTSGPALASSGSLLSVSAGASTILANSSSSLDLRGDTLPTGASMPSSTRNATTARQSTRFPTKTKIAPAPPTLGIPVTDSPERAAQEPAERANVALMSDHLRQHSAGRSGVAWPSHTIPARVKKLSWDDGADHCPEGQRGGRARRDQPHGARPHEPHRLLLNPRPPLPLPQPTHINYHPPPQPNYLPYLRPQSVFDPTQLTIVHSQPNHKSKKCRNIKTKDRTSHTYSYVTNPHHPLVIHPQAINHALLRNMTNAVLPIDHPEAVNRVLVETERNLSNRHHIVQGNINYALPNMVNSVNNLQNPRDDISVFSNNNYYAEQNPHPIKNVSFSSPNKRNINELQPLNIPHSFPVQIIHQAPLTSQNEFRNRLPKPTEQRLPYSFQPRTAEADPQLNQNSLSSKVPLSSPHPQNIVSRDDLRNVPALSSQQDDISSKPLDGARPSAPRRSLVDPVGALLGRGKGPPPEYATIDPRKLRLRTWRPGFLRSSELQALHRTSSTEDLSDHKTRAPHKPRGRR